MAITKITKGINAGNYRVRIQPKDPVTKLPIHVPSKVAPTRQKAKELERSMWGEYEDKKSIPASFDNDSFAELFEQFCKDENEAGRWTNTTYLDWKYTCRLVKKYFGKMKLQDVTESHIRRFARSYIKDHNAWVSRNSTIDRRLQHLRTYFSGLIEKGIIKINPVPKNALHKFFRLDEFTVPDEKYVFTEDEVKNIKERILEELKSLSPSYWGSRIAILIALDTGMRPQEIQALKWNQLINDGNFKVFQINDSWNEKLHRLNGHLKSRVPGFTRLTLPISKEVEEILNIYLQKQKDILNEKEITNTNGFILLNLRDKRLTQLGYPIGQANMNNIIKKVAKLVNVNNQDKQISMYTCRHTKATKLGNTPGMSYPWAASRLGHTVEMFMKRYVHVDKDRSQQMLELVTLA